MMTMIGNILRLRNAMHLPERLMSSVVFMFPYLSVTFTCIIFCLLGVLLCPFLQLTSSYKLFSVIPIVLFILEKPPKPHDGYGSLTGSIPSLIHNNFLITMLCEIIICIFTPEFVVSVSRYQRQVKILRFIYFRQMCGLSHISNCSYFHCVHFLYLKIMSPTTSIKNILQLLSQLARLFLSHHS